MHFKDRANNKAMPHLPAVHYAGCAGLQGIDVVGYTLSSAVRNFHMAKVQRICQATKLQLHV